MADSFPVFWYYYAIIANTQNQIETELSSAAM